jgi:hypothetical protein
MIGQKPGNVKYFNYLGRIITKDARCTREIRYKIAVAKAAFDRNMTLSPANWT